MEVPNGERHMMAVLVVEFVASAIYVLGWLLKPAGWGQPFLLATLICIFGAISGGHFNPSVTIGVYIERKKFKANFCYMILIIVAQLLGTAVALMIAFLLRVSLPDPERPGYYYLVPDHMPFTPPLLEAAEGLPAYGQIFLAEAIATMIFIAIVLYIKDHIVKYP